MKEVVIIGGGYSAKEGVEKGLWDKIKGKEIWSLNYAYKTMPYLPTRELWVDIRFFKENAGELQRMQQQGVGVHIKAHNFYGFLDGINQYKCTREPKNQTDLFIGKMGLVGIFALSLAVKENYDNIWLIGYDFGVPLDQAHLKQTHYYQDKLKTQSTGVKRPEVYLINNAKNVRRDIDDFDRFTNIPNKVHNVSLISNIQCFDKVTWEQFFEKMEVK